MQETGIRHFQQKNHTPHDISPRQKSCFLHRYRDPVRGKWESRFQIPDPVYSYLRAVCRSGYFFHKPSVKYNVFLMVEYFRRRGLHFPKHLQKGCTDL